MRKEKTTSPKTKPKSVALAVNKLHQQSDSHEIVNQTWSDVEALYKDCSMAILSAMSELSVLVNDHSYVPYIENLQEFNVVVRGFQRDMEALATELAGIYELHKHKTGYVIKEDDVALNFKVYGQYMEFFERYKALTLPTVLSITDIVIAAKAKMEKANKTTQEEQDHAGTN